jgi:hypothetical protein
MEHLLSADDLGSWFYLGTVGLFLLVFPVCEVLPVIAAAEIKHLQRRVAISINIMGELESEPMEAFVERHGHDHGA